MLYSTIVMVYFKLKIYVCVIAICNTAMKTDYNRGKLSMGVSLLNPSLNVVCSSLGPNTCRAKERRTLKQFQPDGCPQKLLSHLLSLDVSCWKQYLVHCSVESSVQVIHCVVCPVNTWKLKTLSFSTRLHKMFSCVSFLSNPKNQYTL